LKWIIENNGDKFKLKQVFHIADAGILMFAEMRSKFLSTAWKGRVSPDIWPGALTAGFVR